MLKFDGVVKPLRRGGWRARGLVTTVQHGQRGETQIGPRPFDAEDVATAWLHRIAAERSIAAVRIIVKSAAGSPMIPPPLGALTPPDLRQAPLRAD